MGNAGSSLYELRLTCAFPASFAKAKLARWWGQFSGVSESPRQARRRLGSAVLLLARRSQLLFEGLSLVLHSIRLSKDSKNLVVERSRNHYQLQWVSQLSALQQSFSQFWTIGSGQVDFVGRYLLRLCLEPPGAFFQRKLPCQKLFGLNGLKEICLIKMIFEMSLIP